MKNILNLVLVLIISLSSILASEKGHLVIIGGGSRPEAVMKKIIELSGGENSKIVIIPMASSDPEDVAEYQQNQFKEYGAKNVSYIYCNRKEANSDSILSKMKGVTGVFFSGGNQNNLTKAILGTRLLERINEVYQKGGCVSGTSAGAAVMSEIMITGDELKNKSDKYAFVTIENQNIKTTEGFGFIENAIIDQHFIYRKRHNRLISLVLQNKDLVGVGIDETTSILVYPNKVFEVLGEYQVIIYDASEAENININEQGLFNAEDIKMHILTSGKKYDLINKKIVE